MSKDFGGQGKNNEASCVRMIAALCQETSEAGEIGKRYLSLDKEHENEHTQIYAEKLVA